MMQFIETVSDREGCRWNIYKTDSPSRPDLAYDVIRASHVNAPSAKPDILRFYAASSAQVYAELGAPPPARRVDAALRQLREETQAGSHPAKQGICAAITKYIENASDESKERLHALLTDKEI